MNSRLNILSFLSQRRVQALMLVALVASVFIATRSGDVAETAQSSRVIFVQQASNPGGDGESWNTAYKSLERALASASEGDELWVARGTYKLSSAEAIMISENLTILGGFSGFEVAASEREPMKYKTTFTSADGGTVKLEGDASVELNGIELGGNVDVGVISVVSAAAKHQVTVIYEGVTSVPSITAKASGANEISNFAIPTTVSGATIDDDYFILQEAGREVWVWLDVNNEYDTSSTPADARIILINRFSPSDTDVMIAEKIADALDDEASFDVDAVGNTFAVTNTVPGEVNNGNHASVGSTGFSLSTVAATSVNITGLDTTTTAGVISFEFDTANGSTLLLENSDLSLDTMSFRGWSDYNRNPLSADPRLSVTIDKATTIYMVYGRIIYVDVANTAPIQTGADWTSAYDDLRKAMNEAKANPNATEIWVADGTYNVLTHGTQTRIGQPNSATIALHEGLRLYGGFAGNPTAETRKEDREVVTENGRSRFVNETVLDGQGVVWHIVTGADDAVIDGFVITNGNANGPDSLTDTRGAGMFNYAASPTVRNCVFYGNKADSYGGALYCFIGSPKVENCIFGQKNTIPLQGLRAQPMYPTLRKDSFAAPTDAPTTGFVATNYSALYDNDINTVIVETVDTYYPQTIWWSYIEQVTIKELDLHGILPADTWYLGYEKLENGFYVEYIVGSATVGAGGASLLNITDNIQGSKASDRWFLRSMGGGALITEIDDKLPTVTPYETIPYPGSQLYQEYGVYSYFGEHSLFDNDTVSGAVEAPAAGGALYLDFGYDIELAQITFYANIVDNGTYLVFANNVYVTEFTLDATTKAVALPPGFIGQDWGIVKAGATPGYALLSEIDFYSPGPAPAPPVLVSTPPVVLTESPHLGEAVTILNDGNTKRMFDGDTQNAIVEFGPTGGEVSWTFLDDHIRLIEVGLVATEVDNAVYEVSYFQGNPLVVKWISVGTFRLDTPNELCSTQFVLPRPPPSSPLYEWHSRRWRVTKITPSESSARVSEVVFYAEQPEFSVTHKDPRKDTDPEIFEIHQTDNPIDMTFKLGPSNYLKDGDEKTPVFSTNKLAALGSVTADFGQKTELTYLGFVAATSEVDNNVFSITADGAEVGTFRFDTPGGFNGLAFPSPIAARIWKITQTTATFKSAPVSEIVYNKRQPVTLFGLLNNDPYLLRDGKDAPARTTGFSSRTVEPGNVETDSDDPHILIDIRNYEEIQPSEIVGVSMLAKSVDNAEWTVEYFDYASLKWIALGRFVNDTANAMMGASWPPSAAHRLYRVRQTGYSGITAEYTDLELTHYSHAGNYARFGGGAIYLENKSAPIFSNCDFQGNFVGTQIQQGEDAPEFAAARGGAVSNVGSYPTFDSCDFDANYIWGYGDGGAIYNQGSTTGSTAIPVIDNCTFRRNRASMYVQGSSAGITALFNGYGGAIYNKNSSPQITNSTFGGANKWDGNASTRSGGAIYNDAGSQPSIAQSSFMSNQAIISGGAIFNTGLGAAASISNCSFYFNRAASGGAAYNAGTATTFISCYFKGNVTFDAQKLTYAGSGFVPGFSVYSALVNEQNLEYMTNFIKTTKYNGFSRFGDYFSGWVSGTYEDLEDPIQRNKSMLPPVPEPTPIGGATFPTIAGYYGAKGGAVYNENASTSFSECTFENNPLTLNQSPDNSEFRVASREGGAIYCGGAEATIDPAGSAIEAAGGTVSLTNCKFYGNAASGNGGAVFAGAEFTLLIYGCDFGKKDTVSAANMAGSRRDYEAVGSDALPDDGRGGAIYGDSATISLKETNFFHNHAGPIVEDLQAQAVYPGSGEGGAIYMTGGALTVTDNTYFYRNNAHNDDAATSTSGGAIAYSDTVVTIDKIEFDENYCLNSFNATAGQATAFGGAIYGNGGELTLTGSTFRDNKVNINLTFNTASKANGHIDPTNGTELDLEFFEFVGSKKLTKKIGTGTINAAGGAVYATTGSIVDCTYKWNIAAEGYAAGVTEEGNSSPSSGEGGAVYLGTGEIRSSTFQGNVSSDTGGALHIGSGTVEGSVFTKNWTGWRGSAAYTSGATLTSCTLSENAAGGIKTRNLFSSINLGPLQKIWPASYPENLAGYGAVWGGTVENSLIERNIACDDFDPANWSAVSWGGFGAGAGGAALISTEVRNNVAGSSAALYETSTVGCLVSANMAVVGRGGVSTTGDMHINSTFIANTAADDGGAFGVGSYNYELGTPLQLFHCSLTRNYAQRQGGGVALDGLGLLAEVTNTIIWGNTAGEAASEFDALNEMVSDNGEFSITYSCIRGQETGGISSGVGNIGGQSEDNPLFLNSQGNNLRLQPGSPCIDAGTDLTATYPETETDYDGITRDPSPDMGAHEFLLDAPEIVIVGNSTEIMSGSTTAETANDTAWGLFRPASINGTVQAAVAQGATVVILEGTASDEDDFYKGDYLRIVGGAGAPFTSKIVSYDGSTRTATVTDGFTEALTTTTTYRIYRSHVFTVKNIGIRDLVMDVDAVSISGSNSNDFLYIKSPAASEPTAIIGSGKSTTFTIGYGPTVGLDLQRYALVTVRSNDADEGSYTFGIEGEAGTPFPEIKVTGLADIEIANNDLSPEPADGTGFGELDYRAGAKVVSFSISNIGGGDLELDDITPTASEPTYIELIGDTGDFVVTKQPSTGLVRPSQSVGFEVTFNPVTVGSRSATLTIRNNDSLKGLFRFDIDGEGVGPRIELQGNNQSIVNIEDLKDESGTVVEPLGINTPQLTNYTDFGALDMTKPTAKRYLVIKNSGTQLLNLTSKPSVRILVANSSWSTGTETDSQDFVLAEGPASNVPPGVDTSFAIEYRPNSSGTHFAIVQIDNDDRLFTFRVTGTSSFSGNLPPVAVGTINGQGEGIVEVDIDEPLVLSASGSYDQDGGDLAGIQWDGQGTDFDAPAVPVEFLHYSTAPANSGIYDVTLVVTDDGIPSPAKTDQADFKVLVGKVLKIDLPETLLENSGMIYGAGTVSLANGYTAESDLNISFVVTAGGSLVSVTNTKIYKGLNFTTFDLEVKNDSLSGNTPVTIQASAAGYVTNSVDITIIDDDSPQIVVTGNGNTISNNDVTPSLSDYTEFKPVYDDTSSVEGIFAIRNTGGVDLNLTNKGTVDAPEYVVLENIDLNDSGEPCFEVSLQPAGILGGGSESQFRVTFKPGDDNIRERFATVKITSNAADPTDYTFLIKGTRGANPDIQISYESINIDNGDDSPSTAKGTLYAATPIGFTTNHTFTITNTGDAPLGLSGTPKVRFTGINHTDFVLTTPPASSVVGSVNSTSNTLTFEVGFNPRAMGTRTAILVINNTDPDEDPYTFTLSGEGMPPSDLEIYGRNDQNVPNGSAPDVTTGTDFGDVEVGVPTAQTFTIKNVGTAGTEITLTDKDEPNGKYVQITGSNYFSIIQQPETGLITTSQNEAFIIRYHPLDEGTHTASIRIESNDLLEPVYEFDLQGNALTGIAKMDVIGNNIVISDGSTVPSTANGTDFDQVMINTTKSTTFTITNSGTNSTLRLTGNPFVALENADGFVVVTQPTDTVLDTGESTTFTIAFTPTVDGTAYTGTVVIPHDSSENDYTFAIAGNGTSTVITIGDDDSAGSGCSLTSSGKSDWGVSLMLVIVAMLATRRFSRTGNNSKEIHKVVNHIASTRPLLRTIKYFIPIILLVGIICPATAAELQTLSGKTTVIINCSGKTSRTVGLIYSDQKDKTAYAQLTWDSTNDSVNKTMLAVRNGVSLTVEGTRLKSSLFKVSRIPDAGAASASMANPPIQPGPKGKYKVLAIVLKYSDASVAPTNSQLHGRFFSDAYSMNEYYKEVSRGQLSYEGDVVGPYNVPYSKETVQAILGNAEEDDTTWSGILGQEAIALALADGFDANDYAQTFVIFPPTDNVSWGGLSGSPIKLISTGVPVMIHELGHNLGYGHASANNQEYGDASEVMGSGSGYVNSVRAIQLNYLPEETIETVVADGIYRIESLAKWTDNPKIIRIDHVPPYPTTGPQFISFRAKHRWDEFTADDWLNKVYIHSSQTAYQNIELGWAWPWVAIPSASYIWGELLEGETYDGSFKMHEGTPWEEMRDVADVTVLEIGEDYAIIDIDARGLNGNHPPTAAEVHQVMLASNKNHRILLKGNDADGDDITYELTTALNGPGTISDISPIMVYNVPKDPPVPYEVTFGYRALDPWDSGVEPSSVNICVISPDNNIVIQKCAGDYHIISSLQTVEIPKRPYGKTIRGYILPEETGKYKFRKAKNVSFQMTRDPIISDPPAVGDDDMSTFYFPQTIDPNTDDYSIYNDPSHPLYERSRYPRNIKDTFAGQDTESPEVLLTAGKWYYFEVSGPGSYKIEWTRADSTQWEVVASNFLRPFVDNHPDDLWTAENIPLLGPFAVPRIVASNNGDLTNSHPTAELRVLAGDNIHKLAKDLDNSGDENIKIIAGSDYDGAVMRRSWYVWDDALIPPGWPVAPNFESITETIMLGNWELDGNPFDTGTDLTPNHGTVLNLAAPPYVAGYGVGVQALNCTAATYVDIPHRDEYIIGKSEFSLVATVNFQTALAGTIVARDTWSLTVGDDTSTPPKKVLILTIGGTVIYGTYELQLDKWYQIAIVRDRGKIYMVINQEADTAAVTDFTGDFGDSAVAPLTLGVGFTGYLQGVTFRKTIEGTDEFTATFPVGFSRVLLEVEDREHEVVNSEYGVLVHPSDNSIPVAEDGEFAFNYEIVDRVPLTLIATDADNDQLTYTIESLPSGASGSLYTGQVGDLTAIEITTVPYTLNAGQNVVYFDPISTVIEEQTFTFTATDNILYTGPGAAVPPEALDSNVATFTMDIVEPGEVIVKGAAGLLVTEDAGTATFTVRLSRPTDFSVTVPIICSDVTEATVSPASVVFSDRNWNVPQIVKITGVDDLVDDGDQVVTISVGTPQVVSDSPTYMRLPPQDYSATVKDDDTADVLISKTTLETGEPNLPDTFTVVLQTQPTTSINVAITSGDITEGLVSASSVGPTTTVNLSFNLANWAIPQTVTVTGQDDSLEDGSQIYDLTLVTTTAAPADPNEQYNFIANKTVSVTNRDDDVYIPIINNVTGDTDENGKQATFEVALSREPTALVIVDVRSNDTSEAYVSTDVLTTPAATTSLTFTTSDWDQPQTVTVTGQDDDILDGLIPYTVQVGPTSSSDTRYNKANPDPTDSTVPWPTASLTNADNDTVGLGVSAVSGNTNEDGTTATMTVKLLSKPTADVTIAITSEDTGEVTVAPATLTFTSMTWNTEQIVTFTGVDDPDPDGSRTVNIVLDPASTGDSDYNGLENVIVTVTNEDDDNPGPPTIVVSSLSLSVPEGGSRSLLVKLNQEPLASTIISLSLIGDSDLSIDGDTTLTFNPVNWDIYQSITISAAQDDDADNGTGALLLDAADDAIADVTVTVTEVDDEGDGVITDDDQSAGGGGDGGSCTLGAGAGSIGLLPILILLISMFGTRIQLKRK